MSTCPKCQSNNVLAGAFVLSCDECGWHYLNKHPCRTCGQPATGAMGNGRESIYSCKAHPFTSEERTRAFRRFAEAILSGARGTD